MHTVARAIPPLSTQAVHATARAEAALAGAKQQLLAADDENKTKMEAKDKMIQDMGEAYKKLKTKFMADEVFLWERSS